MCGRGWSRGAQRWAGGKGGTGGTGKSHATVNLKCGPAYGYRETGVALT